MNSFQQAIEAWIDVLGSEAVITDREKTQMAQTATFATVQAGARHYSPCRSVSGATMHEHSASVQTSRIRCQQREKLGPGVTGTCKGP